MPGGGIKANTSLNNRVRPPRSCYSYCMISPIRGDRTSFRVQVSPRTHTTHHTPHASDLRFPAPVRSRWANVAGHRHGSSSRSRTPTLRAYVGQLGDGLQQRIMSPDVHTSLDCSNCADGKFRHSFPKRLDHVLAK